MIIVKLQGGLGNQMFQYAAGRALALEKDTTLKLDLEFLLDRNPKCTHIIRDYDLDMFDVNAVRATREEVAAFLGRSRYRKELVHRIRRRLFPVECFTEPHFHYYERFFDLPRNTYLDGYWQSPNYFLPYESVIRNEFRFKESILPESAKLSDRINQCGSVCVNVRRTDFVTNARTNAHHGVCDMSYFSPAMRMMRERLDHPHFFVFSDDTDWCEHHFPAHDTTVVGHEHKGAKFANYLQLMASCRHFIIPNSTFAWWAIWLSNNPQKCVIAPSHWFADPKQKTSDMIPSDWLRIDN